MNHKVHFMSEKSDWRTPQVFFDKLNKEFNFTLDPCATNENAKCSNYFTKQHNGLKRCWKDNVVFMNPPYGREIKHWIKKAFDEHIKNNITVVMLIPSRTDTQYWHDYVMKADEIRFIKGRLKFEGYGGGNAPFPSCIVVFRSKK